MFYLDDLKPPNHSLGVLVPFTLTCLHWLHCTVAPHFQEIEKALKKNSFNQREAAYIRAAQCYAAGNLSKCTDEFMAMLRDYPLGKYHLLSRHRLCLLLRGITFILGYVSFVVPLS